MPESKIPNIDKLNNESSKSSKSEPTNPAPDGSEPEQASVEINGPKGLDPTRYGDWESKGRCFDF